MQRRGGLWGRLFARGDPGAAERAGAAPEHDRAERKVVPAEFEGSIGDALIAKTLRVPAIDGAPGDGAAVARQVDVALMSVGFKCSRELLEHLSGFHPTVVREAGAAVLRAARELVGDHVEHNVYFIDFPANVPDTLDFWTSCIAQALMDPRSAANVSDQLASGRVNLLDLPTYGRYQHTYDAMLAAHDELLPSAKGRVTTLQLGESLAAESHSLYLSLAGSGVPLSESDLALLATLAVLHVRDPQPERIDVRENRAVVNRARIAGGLPVAVDTPADVLRLACAMSRGDVTLATPTRFRGFSRADRRALLAALDAVVGANPAKLSDVPRYDEAFKRLGERLHPHEYPRWPSAQDAFAVARGEREARSLAGRVDLAIAQGNPDDAVTALSQAPGVLLRSVDRLARSGADVDALVTAVLEGCPSVSTRVLLSLREHLMNRDAPAAARIFVNQAGRSWVAGDERRPLPAETAARLSEVLDGEIARRLPTIARLIVDPASRSLAVPLSGKSRPDGIGILPRGSVQAAGSHIRFFVHWKERQRTTDFDLSVLMLDDAFRATDHVSWTNLEAVGAVHSGDITEAPGGATELIDLDLDHVGARYVVPQVDVYSGEGFNRVEEAFFGFMERPPDAKGRPFEPRTVRAKSDLLGAGRVSLPLMFFRDPVAGWQAKWMHLNLFGRPWFNQVEANYRATSLLARAIAERTYLRLSYIEELLRSQGTRIEESPAPLDAGEPVTYLGLTYPDDLPTGSTVYTPANLADLLNSA